MSSSTSTTTSDEHAFARSFLRLLTSGSTSALAKDYSVDPTTLGNTPFTPLPTMPVPKNKTNNSAVTIKTAQVSLKTIRAPKFSKTFESLPLHDTILSIKESVLKDSSSLGLSSDLRPDNLRFLIKGKVITDSKILENVVTEDENGKLSASFTVMISPSTHSSPVPAESLVSAVSSSPTPTYLADSTWFSVLSELTKSVGKAEAESIISECQELVKSKVSNLS